MAAKNTDGKKCPSENGGYEFPFMRPNKTKWQAFLDGIYNPATKEFLGRTGSGWGKILIFYTIFYIILAALFAICMQGLLATIDDNQPKWQLDSSLIGSNPGLGFRPISVETEEGSLIWYNTTVQGSSTRWVKLLQDFLKPYNNTEPGGNVINCEFDREPKDDQVCAVDMKKFGNCSPDKNFGYDTASPCVFLKLNRIFGWVPDYYNNPDALPEDMPEDLVTSIKNIAAKNGTEQSMNQVWISCQGEGPADKENVNPNFGYYPTRGFPGNFYPYKNIKGYLSPLVAVQIINPTPNVLINIECRAWAKNIQYRGGNRDREGSVRFEIMLDT